MSLKKKLGLGVASAALGLSLIGGGTYAYFSDTAVTNNTFAAGTLNLNAEPTTIINVDNIKPRDTMFRTFKLKNDGSLPIEEVLLSTHYEVADANNNNSEDFAKHIRVNFLVNGDKGSLPIFWTTLDQLAAMSPKEVAENVFVPWLDGGNLAPQTSDTLYVMFEFVDNGADQNQFQGDSLKLKWTFEGKQGAGTSR